MKIKDMFPRKYANGEDLQGQPATLTIAGVKAEAMRPAPNKPEVQKWVIYFQSAKKGVILGRTLAEQIKQALGEDDTDNWTGKRITLYPEPLTVAGVPRIAIRARAAAEQVTQ